MNAIPENLATGVNKRNLIKNIRELYRAKGTKEGHKIFIRMLLDENAEIFEGSHNDILENLIK